MTSCEMRKREGREEREGRRREEWERGREKEKWMMRMRIGKLAEESEIPSDVVPFAGMSSFHQIKK